MTSLPYGSREVKLSNNKKIDIPLTIRRQHHSEVIRMFQSTDDGKDTSLSTRTMYRILAKCSALRSKRLTCVDIFEALGGEVFFVINIGLI